MKLSFVEPRHSALQPGVEQIPEGVTENIEAVDGDHRNEGVGKRMPESGNEIAPFPDWLITVPIFLPLNRC